MKLTLNLREEGVEQLDIDHITHIAQTDVSEYFKQKKDFNCFSYQGGLELDLDILDIEYLVNNYYHIELTYDTINT